MPVTELYNKGNVSISVNEAIVIVETWDEKDRPIGQITMTPNEFEHLIVEYLDWKLLSKGDNADERNRM